MNLLSGINGGPAIERFAVLYANVTCKFNCLIVNVTSDTRTLTLVCNKNFNTPSNIHAPNI
jgi:hypothetical protein